MPSTSGPPRKRILRGRLALASLFLVAAIYCVFFIPIGWVLLLFPFAWVRRQYRKWTSTVQLLLLGFLGYIVEFFCQIRIVITGGDEMLHVLPAKPLIISNRQGDLDWFVLVCLSLRLHRLAVFKVATWEDYAHIPFIGWLIQSFMFPTICGRDKVKDLATIRNVVEYLVTIEGGVTMVLFPEGSSVAVPESLAKSHAYSDKHNLPRLHHVLVPRVPGIFESIRSLNRLNAIDAIVDATIGYLNYDPASVGSVGASVYSFWNGTYPKEVHVNLNYVRWIDIPPDVDSMRSWLIERFIQKDKMLERFYAPLKFLDGATHTAASPCTSPAPTGITNNSFDEDQMSTTSTHVSNLATYLCFHEEGGDSPEPCEETFSKDMRFIQYISNSYVISAVVAFMVTVLIAFWAVRCPEHVLFHFIFVCLVFTIVTRSIGGVHVLETEILPVRVDFVSLEYYPADLDTKRKSFFQRLKDLFVVPKDELVDSAQKDKSSYIRATKSKRIAHRQQLEQ